MPKLVPKRQPEIQASQAPQAPQAPQVPQVPQAPQIPQVSQSLHQPFYHQLPLLPSKRQTSRRDPRLIAGERKRSKLGSNETFSVQVFLNKGDENICKVTLKGGLDKVPQSIRIKYLLQLQAPPQGDKVTIHSFLPLKRLNDFLTDRSLSFLSIIPADQYIQASKLRGFLSVNEITGVVCHPDMPTEALFIMASRDLAKLSHLPTETGLDPARLDQLSAIFIDKLPPRPPIKLQDIEYLDNDSDHLFSWCQMCKYLKFPPTLSNMYQTTTFLVYGHSESSVMLTKAALTLPPVIKKPVNPLVPHNVMMFDRFNNELQYKNLLKHKREPVTQIWEFGAPSFYHGDIEPACEVFPQHSGGFITTDINNIVNNPNIIVDICEQIKKFNEFPVAYGEWRFVLPHNFLHYFNRMIRNNTGYGNDQANKTLAIQEAIINITIALSNSDIEVMRVWPQEKEEPNFVVFMKHVFRQYYKTHQYFVYVDDMDSVAAKVKENHVSIDFVKTDSIFKTFA